MAQPGTADRDPAQAASDVVERARALAPLLAQHADEAERLRRPADAVIRALEEARIFEIMVPRCYGGLELDLDTALEVGLELGEGDTSMAWVASFYIEHCWMFCQFPEAFQRVLFADRRYVLAPGAVAPAGLATPVPGGFRLSGRWQWATGLAHADWVLIGARVDRPDTIDMRLFALPIAEVEVEDTWHVDGMIGTGSNDILVDGATIPAERSVSFTDMAAGIAHGASLHEGPLYRTPMLSILALAAAAPAVGQARAVLRGFRERLEGRVLYGSGAVQADQPAAQMRLARAEIEVRRAEALLRATTADVQELRQQATLGDRARWLASIAFAVHESVRVVRQVAEASGASAHFRSDPLQRAVRDLGTLSCHVIFDLDARLEAHGRAMLGQDPGAMV